MKGEKITKSCNICKTQFTDYISNKRSSFCSLPCYWKSKNGSSGYWLGKKRDSMVGVKNNKWLGDEVGYANLHAWLKRHKVKSNICEHCNENKKTDWANKSHKYLRSLNDWLELCRKCHIHYDKKSKGIATKIYGKI